MSEGFSTYKSASLEELVANIEAELDVLPKQEAKVAQYVLLNLDSLSFETGQTISRKAGVAEITVGRMLRRFGCGGMKDLKALLRNRYSIVGDTPKPKGTDLSAVWRDQLTSEVAALQSVYSQIETENFKRATQILSESEQVFVTGFQTVRGLAEDTAKRLSLARNEVHFLSVRDSMLLEWIDRPEGSTGCLLMIDVVPYAVECESLAILAREQGLSVIVVSDEYCHWARKLADAAIFSASATGLFLESTLGLSAALGLLIHSVANAQEDGGAARLQKWKRLSHRLKIF